MNLNSATQITIWKVKHSNIILAKDTLIWYAYTEDWWENGKAPSIIKSLCFYKGRNVCNAVKTLKPIIYDSLESELCDLGRVCGHSGPDIVLSAKCMCCGLRSKDPEIIHGVAFMSPARNTQVLCIWFCNNWSLSMHFQNSFIAVNTLTIPMFSYTSSSNLRSWPTV